MDGKGAKMDEEVGQVGEMDVQNGFLVGFFFFAFNKFFLKISFVWDTTGWGRY